MRPTQSDSEFTRVNLKRRTLAGERGVSTAERFSSTVIMLNTDPDNLGALLSDWVKSGRRSSPNTAESYRRNIRDFMRFCGKILADVTVADVVSYASRSAIESKEPE